MNNEQNLNNPQRQQLNIAGVISCGDLKEPNHLDYKVQNKYDEWIWKSPYAMNRYADEWDKWYQQEREKFKTKHGLTDEEMNYNPDEILGRGSNSHCL